LPAFNTLCGKNVEIEISIDHKEGKPPSAELQALAVKVVYALDVLVPKAIAALWADLNGDENHFSRVWWHGDLEGAFDLSDDVDPPTNPKELASFLKPEGISLRPSVWKYKKPVVILHFKSDIDAEHGIGMLTDGEQIIGIGYSADPAPFFGREYPPTSK